MKAQALTDFLQETTHDQREQSMWKIYVDGSSTKTGVVRFQFKASNNETEYEALLQGLQLPGKVGTRRVNAHSDSQLVTQQLLGKCEVREKRMLEYVEKVRSLKNEFESFEIKQIPQEKNRKAYYLANIGSSMTDCHERKITVFGVGKAKYCQ